MYNNKCKPIMRNPRHIWLISNLMLHLIKKVLVHTHERVFTAINMVTFCDTTVTLRLAVTTILRIRTFMFTILSIESNFTGYTCANNYYCKVNL